MARNAVDARELAEVIVCVARIIAFVRAFFPDYVEDLLALEDELLDTQQELR